MSNTGNRALAFVFFLLQAACSSSGGHSTTNLRDGAVTSNGGANAGGGSSSTAGKSGLAGSNAGGVNAGGANSGGGTSAGGASPGGSGNGGSANGGAGGAPSADAGVSAAGLLALTANCNEVTNGRYKTDEDSQTATVAICQLPGTLFWQADMDIDCDGVQTTACSLKTDPDFQAQTSATDSQGNFLDSAALPYVVVPLPSTRFNYKTAGLSYGSVIAVVYKGKISYGVFGDEGPNDIIGEASVAMATSLGVDPNPATGGTDSGVTYFAFTGKGAVATVIEDHAEAVSIGEAHAAALIANP